MTGEEYFKRVSQIIEKCGNPKFEQFEGYHGYIPVLSILSKECMTAGAISEKFKISTARVAKILNYLEDKKYVVRQKQNNDKRVTFVCITDDGKKHLEEFWKDRANDMNYVLDGIPDSDIEAFFRVTEVMVKRICRKKVEENA